MRFIFLPTGAIACPQRLKQVTNSAYEASNVEIHLPYPLGRRIKTHRGKKGYIARLIRTNWLKIF